MMNLEFILQISVIRVRVPATCGSPKSCTDIFIRGNPFSNPFRISLDNVSNAPFFTGCMRGILRFTRNESVDERGMKPAEVEENFHVGGDGGSLIFLRDPFS